MTLTAIETTGTCTKSHPPEQFELRVTINYESKDEGDSRSTVEGWVGLIDDYLANKLGRKVEVKARTGIVTHLWWTSVGVDGDAGVRSKVGPADDNDPRQSSKVSATETDQHEA